MCNILLLPSVRNRYIEAFCISTYKWSAKRRRRGRGTPLFLHGELCRIVFGCIVYPLHWLRILGIIELEKLEVWGIWIAPQLLVELVYT